MRDQKEIKKMAQRFDSAITPEIEDNIDDDTRGVWDALCWVVDETRPDSLVTDYLPDERMDDENISGGKIQSQS